MTTPDGEKQNKRKGKGKGLFKQMKLNVDIFVAFFLLIVRFSAFT